MNEPDRPIGIGKTRARAQHGFGDGIDGLFLAHDASMQLVFEMQQPLFLTFQQLGNRDSRPAGDDGGNVVFVHLLFGEPRSVLMRQPRFLGRQLFLQSGEGAVPKLGYAVQIVLALGLFDLDLRRLDLFAQLPQLDCGILLRVPTNAQLGLILAQRRQLFLELLQTPAARAVVFLAQRFAFDLELHHAARDLVELLGHRIDLGAQRRARFVDEIDRLVR